MVFQNIDNKLNADEIKNYIYNISVLLYNGIGCVYKTDESIALF